MVDKNNVIKGLECCQLAYECKPYERCPYSNGYECGDCDINQLHYDALSLLKEQETVKPILKREGRNKYYNDYVCPRCDNDVVYEQNYCSECGVRFLWERAVK